MNETLTRPLVQRLERVESENRRLKRIGVLAVLGLGALMLLGQATPSAITPAVPAAKVIEAEKFVLRDPTGRERAELSVLADGSPTLGFVDPDGKPRALFGLGADGAPGLALLGPDDKGRLTLSVRRDGAAAVILVDAGGRPRARLDLETDGVPGLTFFARGGGVRAALGVMDDGRLFVFPGGQPAE